MRKTPDQLRHSGRPERIGDQKLVTATVIRSEADADVAILRCDQAKGTPALPLGEGEEVYETQPLTVLGFPFGQNLALDKEEFPSVTVSSGRITSLRKKKGVLELLQLDASLNPGNSGGPVVDGNGKVVGIVRSGMPGTGINFAVPLAKVRAILEKPELTFLPDQVPFKQRGQECDFTVKLEAAIKPKHAYDVEVWLKAGEESKVVSLKPVEGAEGTFRARTAPIPSAGKEHLLKITASYSTGILSGRAVDKECRLRNKTMWLSELKQVKRGDEVTTSLRSGEEIPGWPGGIEILDLDLGPTKVKADLARSSSILIEDLNAAITSVGYTVVVRLEGREVRRVEGTIKLVASTPTTSTTNPTSTQLIDPARIPFLGDKVTRKLPGVADDIVAGAGGRVLLFHFKSLKKLAVFDVQEASIVKELPLPSQDVVLAADASTLVVLARDARIMQRWDLLTLEKELTVPLPEIGNIESICAGYAATGPMLVTSSAGPPVFLDPGTMKRQEIRFDRPIESWKSQPHPLIVRSSADGTFFAACRSNTSPSSILLINLSGQEARGGHWLEDRGVVVPATDGSLLFTSKGVLTPEQKLVGDDQLASLVTFPSYHPSFFLAGRFTGEVNREKKSSPRLMLYTTHDRRFLVGLPDVDEVTTAAFRSYPTEPLTIEKRIHLMPWAILLVTLADSRDEVVVRRFVLSEWLDKKGIDYLFVESTPPSTAPIGKKFEYTPRICSKRGGVRVSLDSGPKGMVLTSRTLNWDPPANQLGQRVAVVLRIIDATGQEMYHSFVVMVR